MNQIYNNNQALTKHSQPQRKQADLSSLVYGKLPPQALELESDILGAILLERSAFDIVSEILRPDCFYKDAHQKIYKACQELAQRSEPIDMRTVVEHLKKTEELDNIGGPFYIIQLTNSVKSSANIETYCRIVLQKFIQRELIRIGGEIVNDAYQDSADIFDLFDKAESSFYNISTQHFRSDYSHLAAGMPKFIGRIEFLKQQEQPITGVPTGFKELDKITHGWQPTDLIILAARPSVGKTAFALNLAKNAATSYIKKTPVGLFSLEMSTLQLLQRVVSMDTEIWMEQLANGKVSDTSILYKSGDRINKMEIYIDDTAGLSLMELRSKARRMVSKHQVGLIIIDYLQLMSGDEKRNGNREQEISSISRGLKKLAKELHIPIIALSQLSREVEKRGKGQKIPQLSDLRESGAIEQDADLVMFLYRPPDDEIADDYALANKAMARIAKHRNGKLESFAFEVDNNIQRWGEIGLLETKKFVPVNIPRSEPVRFYNEPKKDSDEEMPF